MKHLSFKREVHAEESNVENSSRETIKSSWGRKYKLWVAPQEAIGKSQVNTDSRWLRKWGAVSILN